MVTISSDISKISSSEDVLTFERSTMDGCTITFDRRPVDWSTRGEMDDAIMDMSAGK